MGQIITICDCSKQNQTRILSRVSRLKNDASQENLMVKKLAFHQISDVFPYRYLGKGLYGTTVQVFVKQDKKTKFAQKIVPQENLTQNYICYDTEIVDRIMLDQTLKHKIVKVHAYSINNQKRKMYLIMDLMKKSDLYFHLCRLQKKNGRFYPEAAIKRIAYELLDTIERFHSYNLIFRNLRSENIFIKENGKLAVSDFFFAINGPKCHTYYGAAEYAPPEVYYLQRTVKTINQRALRNLNEFSDATEERQLRLSPDVRRYNLNNFQNISFKTKSCDLKEQIQYLKLKSKKTKQYESMKQKSSDLGMGNKNGKKTEQKQDKQTLKTQQLPSRKDLRTYTNINPQTIRGANDRQKHYTYIIPEQPFGENSQVKQDSKGGPGYVKIKYTENDDFDECNSNISSNGGGRQYDQSIDLWMLGVLLFQLIYGRTPFEKWKGTTSDGLSKAPACPSYAENLIELENNVKNKNIQDIWSENSTSVSTLERIFIDELLIRQPQKRKSPAQMKKHPFLKDCNMITPLEQLIYEHTYDPKSFESDIKYVIRHKDSGLVANRTILRKKSNLDSFKNRITQKLFQHQKSVHQTN